MALLFDGNRPDGSVAPVDRSWPRRIARLLLGGFLVFAGVGHLSFARREFQAQVPDWVPLTKDATVLASGVVEIALGGAVALVPRPLERQVGWIAAAFFVGVFPGNLAQFTGHRDAFGLDTDLKRGVRLLFQPALVAWALWSTNALKRRR